tara:strand:+ start:1346 stop:1555 length:210 start_codon:yes stop_codon:yes gene_type:complete
MKLDIKTAITIGALLFTIAGFYYTTKSDINSLSLRVKGLQAENHDIRKRLDSIDKKLSRINKKLRGSNK